MEKKKKVMVYKTPKAQDGMEMDAAQFAAEENAAAAQQGYPQAQQASEGASRQMNPEDLLGEVVNALAPR